MHGYTNRKWLSIAIVAVVLPLGLMVALKIAGWIPDPTISEITAVEAKTCNIIQPRVTLTFAKWIENSYSDNIVSISLKVAVGTYAIGDSTYNYLDIVNLHTDAAARTAAGFIYSMNVEFTKGSNATSAVNFVRESMESANVTVKEEVSSWSDTREAYVNAEGVDRPKDCRLVNNVDWVFLDAGVDNKVTVTLNTVCFNGTAYRRMLIPITIVILTKAGRSIETAKTIAPGSYYAYLNYASHYENYYSIFVGTNQTVHAQATSEQPFDFDIYLYDHDGKLVANSSQAGGTEEVTFKTTQASVYFILVTEPPNINTPGYYTLTVTLSTSEGGG